jgi:hypothetical protein
VAVRDPTTLLRIEMTRVSKRRAGGLAQVGARQNRILAQRSKRVSHEEPTATATRMVGKIPHAGA